MREIVKEVSGYVAPTINSSHLAPKMAERFGGTSSVKRIASEDRAGNIRF